MSKSSSNTFGITASVFIFFQIRFIKDLSHIRQIRQAQDAKPKPIKIPKKPTLIQIQAQQTKPVTFEVRRARTP